MREYYMWMNHLRCLSLKKKMSLLSTFGSPEEVYKQFSGGLVEQLSEEGFLTDNAVSEISASLKDDWFQNYESKLKELDISYVTPEDETYPERLLNIFDSPLALFYRGDISLLRDDRTLAVIGTRRPTGYGRLIAEKFARELAKEGITIISGMASGIDSIAHMAALENAGRTVAVLGCGVERCYPEENYSLYRRLINAGLIISEYGPGVLPLKQNFPERNRIISGLSDGILVVEAKKKSGTMITVDSGLEQGKTIYAIPGRIGDIQSEGTNRLIKSGAILVTEPEDVLSDYGFSPTDLPQTNLTQAGLTQTDLPQTNLTQSGTTMPRTSRENPSPATLSRRQQCIMDCLSVMPVFIDDIIRTTKDSVSAVISTLAELEKMGCAIQVSPGYYSKKI